MGKKRLSVLTAALVATVGLAATVWYRWSYLPPRFSPADPAALAALESGADVEVSQDRWIVMRPTAGMRSTGLVFYPGGQVAPEGYAEPLRRIATAGFLVVLVPMPLDLAVLAPDRAQSVIAGFPDISRWVIGGHSLGGAMAARFVHSYPNAAAALLLWDSYPDGSDDLSGAALPVRQLVRLRADGSMPEVYQETRRLLPPATQIVPLPGATHMNYGRFIAADRLRDAEPSVIVGTMPIEEQHARVVAASIDLMEHADAAVGSQDQATP